MNNFIRLETPRLILKGISNEYMHFIFDNFTKSEIMEVLGHRSDDDYDKEKYKHLNGYASYNRKFLLFILVDKASHKIIGRCGLHNWNQENRRAEIGYNMEDEEFKKRGFMSEAVKAILEHGFNTLKLNRIEALVSGENIPSLNLLMKYQFVKEGVLREHLYDGEKYTDSILLARLNADHVVD